MTPESLWTRYAGIWSLEQSRRELELIACVSDDITYCDPNGLIAGRSTLSDYMGQFQQAVPGGVFHIRTVLHHHDRSLADWALHGKDGTVLQNGTSFGALGNDGRLRSISGFFRAKDSRGEQ